MNLQKSKLKYTFEEIILEDKIFTKARQTVFAHIINKHANAYVDKIQNKRTIK